MDLVQEKQFLENHCPGRIQQKKLNGQLMAIGNFELKERYMYIVIIEVYTFYILIQTRKVDFWSFTFLINQKGKTLVKPTSM